MVHIGKFIKDEVVAILPAMIFFFAAFTLIALTQDLAVEQYKLKVFHFTGAAIGALLVAKALLIVDALPWTKAVRTGPLIYVTLWKTGIYLFAVLIVLYLEHMIPLMVRYRNLGAANRDLFTGVVWARIAAILIWVAVLLFVFAAFQELIRVLGKGSLRRMFFGH